MIPRKPMGKPQRYTHDKNISSILNKPVNKGLLRNHYLNIFNKDESIVSRAIELNEQLQKVLARHDDLLAGRTTTTAPRFDHEEAEEEEELEQLVRRS
ncbi:uncharacterized protein LOC114915628 isoform X2 [Cajanus cajan]|uniref:uncharacterized protein LOC114915628 isoform X2 n=1 Tax=Cajanus cajan TaxID=3821 RepID=UPI0010FB2B1B|nr:uncharacterized protein LOC114915628 isoform X2 [Cajanus cajan]